MKNGSKPCMMISSTMGKLRNKGSVGSLQKRDVRERQAKRYTNSLQHLSTSHSCYNNCYWEDSEFRNQDKLMLFFSPTRHLFTVPAKPPITLNMIPTKHTQKPYAHPLKVPASATAHSQPKMAIIPPSEIRLAMFLTLDANNVASPPSNAIIPPIKMT